MKRLMLCIMLTVSLASQPALAACDFSSDIVKVDANTYQYTKECHIEVGKIKKAKEELEKASDERKKQVSKLTESIKLKDLALDTADQRIMNWRVESYRQHERLLKQQRLNKYNDWMYFAGGVLSTVISVWAAGQLK